MVYAGVGGRERRERAMEALQMVGMENRARHRPMPALRRPAAARRHRAGAGQPAQNRLCRRAHRQPGLAHRRSHPRTVPHASAPKGRTIALVTHDPEIAAVTPAGSRSATAAWPTRWTEDWRDWTAAHELRQRHRHRVQGDLGAQVPFPADHAGHHPGGLQPGGDVARSSKAWRTACARHSSPSAGVEKVRVEDADIPPEQQHLADQAVGITMNDVRGAASAALP